jgi:polysaccharide biosynthesis transport protein
VDKLDNIEIRLEDIFYTLLKGWKTIVLFIFIFLLLGYVFTAGSGKIAYTTNASMVVNSKQIKVINGEITLTNDIYLSQKIVDTYRVILLSDNVLEKVNMDLGTDIPPETMRKWLTVTSPKGTEVIIVSVKNEDPQLAADIANSMMAVAPRVISETVEVGSINVIDYAKPPEIPQRKDIELNIAVAIALGLLTGSSIVFLNYYLRPKLRNKKEIVEKLSLSSLGELPHIKSRYKNKNQQPLITDDNIDLVFVEEVKLFMEKVLSACKSSDIKKLIVTSAGPGEGKTFASANLALSLALSGKSVLLIDFDYYKNRLDSLFNVEYGKSLIDVLNGEAQYTEVIVEEPKSGLHMLFFQKGVYLDSDKINNPYTQDLFETVGKNYDFVIIDTPPALIQSEPVSLSKYADAVMLVVKQERETVKNIIETRDRFLDVGSKVIGVVLNDIRYRFGTSYGNKYAYSKQYYSNINEGYKSGKAIFGKAVISVIFLILVSLIFYFASRTGEQIINIKQNIFEFILEKAQNLGILEDRYDGKIMDTLKYSDQIRFLSKVFENWIHTILFFVITIVTMGLFRVFRISTLYSAILTVVLSIILSFGNEYFQSLFVKGRGFDFTDIIFGFIGVTAAFIIYLIYRVVKRISRTSRTIRTDISQSM